MEASLRDLMGDAARRDAAVGAFTCYNLEGAIGVLRAAERRECGVVLLVSPASFRRPGGPSLTAALATLTARAGVPACVQLDHASDLTLIEDALHAGVHAVMADGSSLPLEGNLTLVQKTVRMAARFGASVEAELGRIEGDEDVAAAAEAGELTDPAQAADFVERTGVDCLAVSIGNVHGTYMRPPDLDWERLRRIRERVAVPLSLHGTSGLARDDVARAIGLGIAKFNVNTELREAYLRATTDWLAENPGSDSVLDLNAAQAEAIVEISSRKLGLE